MTLTLLLCTVIAWLVCAGVGLLCYIRALEDELAMANRVIQIDTQLLCVQDQMMTLEDYHT